MLDAVAGEPGFLGIRVGALPDADHACLVRELLGADVEWLFRE